MNKFPNPRLNLYSSADGVTEELIIRKTQADGTVSEVVINPLAVHWPGIVLETQHSQESEPDLQDGTFWMPGRVLRSWIELTVKVTLEVPSTSAITPEDNWAIKFIEHPAPESVGACTDPSCTLDHSPDTDTDTKEAGQ